MGALNSINLTVTEPQLGELFELNDAYYNDEKETPFWEFPIKGNTLILTLRTC